jgi:peroxiredoxin
MSQLIQAGETAPNIALTALGGEPVTLKELQAGRALVLYFMRTFTCSICRRHVRHLANRETNLAWDHVRIAVVGQGSHLEAADLAAKMKVRLPLLADPDHTAHRTFGLGRVLLGAVQQSGTVLIDRRGTIRYILRATNPLNGYDGATLLEEISALVRSYEFNQQRRRPRRRLR